MAKPRKRHKKKKPWSFQPWHFNKKPEKTPAQNISRSPADRSEVGCYG